MPAQGEVARHPPVRPQSFHTYESESLREGFKSSSLQAFFFLQASSHRPPARTRGVYRLIVHFTSRPFTSRPFTPPSLHPPPLHPPVPSPRRPFRPSARGSTAPREGFPPARLTGYHQTLPSPPSTRREASLPCLPFPNPPLPLSLPFALQMRVQAALAYLPRDVCSSLALKAPCMLPHPSGHPVWLVMRDLNGTGAGRARPDQATGAGKTRPQEDLKKTRLCAGLRKQETRDKRGQRHSKACWMMASDGLLDRDHGAKASKTWRPPKAFQRWKKEGLVLERAGERAAGLPEPDGCPCHEPPWPPPARARPAPRDGVRLPQLCRKGRRPGCAARAWHADARLPQVQQAGT